MLNVRKVVMLLLLTQFFVNTASAGEVNIVTADFRTADNRLWSIQVTLQHADSGWDHYADHWRVVDPAGNVVADRVLYHPHVDEQPFTRGLQGIPLQPEMGLLVIEAHDTVHGWSRQRLQVDLSQAVNRHLRLGKE